METELRRAADLLRRAENVLVFTGAGISAESGIPTFRDADGFWNEFPPEEYANWPGLMKVASLRPRDLARFLHAVIEPIANAAPNAAHRAIADAESHLRITVVTQNIDGLHQQAGSTIVHEVHGSLLETMTDAGKFHSLVTRQQLREVAEALERAQRGVLTLARILVAVRCLAGFGRGGVYRPKIVLFNDAMAEPDWFSAQRAAESADCVLQVGCSRQVYPAAGLPRRAKLNGAQIIAVDPHSQDGDVYLRGTATEVVPRLLELATR